MNLLSVSSAFPKKSYTQIECLEAMQAADFWPELHSRSRMILEKVLTGNSGIDKRHFSLDQLTDAWTRDAQSLNNAYEKVAPALAAEAVEKAVAKSGYKLDEVDAVFLSSCTGYLCPGVTSYMAEILGLREDVFLQDMTGLGCGAAVPLIRAASGVVALNPAAVVVTVAVEVCSAAFYVENDFGVLISTCLFGDGAAAAVWSGQGGSWAVDDFQSIHIPSEREKIRFTNAAGKLRNQLHRSVPELAAATVKRLYDKRAAGKSAPDAFVTHGGGRDVIERLEASLPDIPQGQLKYARNVMQNYGNLSSPSVLVALEQFLEDDGTSRNEFSHVWMCAFGAGFSAHSCELYRV
ncbi:MAG: 3-oxoacyl-[acyl-carrier-protein] synthase III C-terminal domain-containing protein [Akkermansiaceae bacterium]